MSKMRTNFSFDLDKKENRIKLKNEVNGQQIQEALISIGIGSNLCRYSYNGLALINFDESLLRSGDFTGTPVLYPTPNRVENGILSINGINYRQEKRGKVVLEHGLVYDEPWVVDEIIGDKNWVSVRTKIEWHKKQPFYSAFPFTHRITLRFLLTNKGLTISYEIQNLDKVELPYGFGLHPYFQKISGDEGTQISVPVKYVMEATEKLIPTGEILAVKNTSFDLNEFSSIGSHELDHVFIRKRNSTPAVIQFKEQGVQLRIHTSKDFSYFVIYSPPSSPFFCLETQTCSTNAHNLFDRGFKKVSGLRFIKPGKSAGGQVMFEVSKIETK